MRYWELNEAFDKPPTYKITRDNLAQLELRATIGDRDIIFHAQAQGPVDGKDAWEIDFTEEGNHPETGLYATSGKTGSGNEFQVFALVMEGVKLLIQKRNPGILMFSAVKQGSTANRASLYSRMVKKLMPAGWEARESSTEQKTNFWLEKKDLKEGISYTLIPGEKFYRELFPRGDMSGARKRLKYLSNYNDWAGELDFTAKDGDKVVGVAGCHMNKDEERVMSVWFLSVDPQYQNQGIGKQLADMVFRYAHDNNLRVRASSYTEMGAQYIKGAFEAMVKKYSVPFKDGNDHYLFDFNPGGSTGR